MNKQWTKGVTVSAFSLFMAAAVLWPIPAAQEPEHKKIVEKVTVTNIEVPVRVLYKGNPVTDLSAEDFTIYENKKQVKINGFFLKRKKIDLTGTQKVVTTVNRLLPRAFVLVFSITDFNDNLKKAVDHIFSRVLRPNDRLMIFVNDRTITHPRITDGATIKQQLTAHLRKESKKARRRLILYINNVENLLRVHDFRVQLARRDDQPRRLLDYLKKYLRTWNDYKNKYLTPRIDRFYYFSRYLENMKAEKWVLNFYQFDLFPKIRLGSDTMEHLRDLSTRLILSESPSLVAIGKMINSKLNEILVALNVSKGVPTREISKLFHKVDATFHSFFIRGTNTAGNADFEYDEVASGIENTLKEITRITGGRNITSNKLVQSIETVSQLEDCYYMLTYVPADPKKSGQLKIKVKNKKYKVYYDDNFRADYIADYLEKLEKNLNISDIRIRDFSFKGKILAFTVFDFLVREANEKKNGRINVRIRLINNNSKVLFDQARNLTARDDEIKISLNLFRKIKKGEYDFVIDAIDLFSGKQTNFLRNVIVKR
jgi:VWFA-related protein